MRCIHFGLLILSIAFFAAPILKADTQVNEENIFTYSITLATKKGPLEIEIHGSLKNRAYINQVARILKDHSAPIIDYFDYIPRETVHFTVNDKVYLANGFATVFPRDLIGLLMPPPLGESHLVDQDSFLKKLVLHEFVHILHLDRTEGGVELIRKLFGNLAKAIGMVSPRWFPEGVAVWAETKFTDGGRLRNRLLEYEFRTVLNGKSCSSIACVDEPGHYPKGSYAYWMGSHLLDFVERQKPGSLRCIVRENADNFILFLDDSIKTCTGKFATEWYQRYLMGMKAAIVRGQKRIEKNQLWSEMKFRQIYGEDSAVLWGHGYELFKNQLFFVYSDAQGVPLLRYLDLENGAGETITHPEFNITHILPFSDYSKSSGKTLIGTSTYHKLHSRPEWRHFNLKSKKFGKPITFKKAAQYAFAIGPDAYSYLHFENGTWEIINVKGSSESMLYKFPALVEISTPKLISNTQLLFKEFSYQKLHQHRLVSINLHNGKKKVLHTSSTGFQVNAICGEDVVLENKKNFFLYRGRQGKLSGPRRAAKELASLRLNSSNSVALLTNDAGLIRSSGTSCKSFLKQLFKTKKVSAVKVKKSKKKDAEITSEESYSSVSHMLPRWWYPSFNFGSNVTDYIGFNTGMSDPVGFHSINLEGNYFSELEEFGPSAFYEYNTDPTTPYSLNIGLGYSKFFFDNDIRDIPDRFELKKLYLSRPFMLGPFSHKATLSFTQADVADFVSTRTFSEYALSQVFFHQTIYDYAFLQDATFLVKHFYQETKNRRSFAGQEYLAQMNFRLGKKVAPLLQASYGSLDKSDLGSGVLYGGGYGSIFQSITHEFYGISNNDAFGNEILTARFQLDIHLASSNNGPDMLPLFLRKTHFLIGMDYLKTDFIFVSGRFLANSSISSAYGGLRFKGTLGWMARLKLDLLYVNIFDETPRDENQVLFVVTGDF
ncbi:MAG: hypothetical protein HOM21_13210 [Halobacteriovoraceae bacterium]|nr:hypothetical protein [Halobacteriovoraceae bacterium]